MEAPQFLNPTSDSGKRVKIVSSWDCGSLLYDSYELASIFNQLDRGLAALYPSSTPPSNHHNCHISWVSSQTHDNGEGDPTSDSGNKVEIVSLWDCGSSFYDSYELASMFNQLDRGLAALYPSSTPPPDLHNCHISWISSQTQKLKRAPCQYTSGFDRMEDGCKRKVNENHRLRWLCRLPWIVSHSVKAIASCRGDATEYPSQKQIIKEYAEYNGGKTRKGSGSNTNVYKQNLLDIFRDSAKAPKI